MKSENEKALLQTQLESEQLQSEYQVLQTEKAARIQELESELTALQERSVSEVETMQARVATSFVYALLMGGHRGFKLLLAFKFLCRVICK